jgi:hypothetical protein
VVAINENEDTLPVPPLAPLGNGAPALPPLPTTTLYEIPEEGDTVPDNNPPAPPPPPKWPPPPPPPATIKYSMEVGATGPSIDIIVGVLSPIIFDAETDAIYEAVENGKLFNTNVVPVAVSIDLSIPS